MKKKILLFALKWIGIFFVVSVIAFVIPRTIPKDPVRDLLVCTGLDATEENIAIISEAWGLNEPLHKQYIIWITNFLQGDWGNTMNTKQDIREALISRLPYSIGIAMGGLLLSAVISFFLGFGAAIKNNGICDKISRALSLLSMSVPSFVLTVIIVYFFGVKLGAVKFFTGNGVGSMMFAILLMALTTTGPIARVVKTHFREQMTEPYITFAVSRGFSKKYVLLRHGCKPVLYALISVMISRIAYAMGGSTILEYSFGIPGVSSFLVESMHAADFYVLQSYLMIVVMWMFGTHLIFNLLLNYIDVRNAE